MKSLLLSFCVMLAACGGGGSAPPSAAAPLVVAYGDSTMVGLGTTPLAYMKAGIAFQNEGVSGTNIEMLLAGADTKHATFAQEIANSKATIIVINHGINSAIISENISVETYRADMQNAVNIALNAGKRVILDTPNPVVPGGSNSGIVDIAKLDAMAQAMREITGVTLCDEAAAIRAANLDNLTYLPDGVHPSAALYDFKARKLAGCINSL